MADVRHFFRVLGQGLSLAFWRRPGSRPELSGFGTFLVCCAVALLAFGVQDNLLTVGPAEFDITGFDGHASYFLVLLLAAWAAARLLRRPVMWLTLATLLVLVGIPWTTLSLQVNEWFGDSDNLRLYAWRVLLALAGFTAVARTIGFVAGSATPLRRLAASMVFVLILAFPWYWQQTTWFWYPPEEVAEDEPAPTPEPPAKARASSIDAEQVLFQQPQLVQHALDAVRAQTPGKIDLFPIGFAGDGDEKVFRNEVEYFDRLMSQRFDAAGRTLALINAPETVQRTPLATLTNLRASLAGVAARMDTSEDVLVLFLTSHGSEEHTLYVGLEDMPLRQIEPRDLRAALDESGIRWRVVVVSACYSGGFVDALRDSGTLVITAARADRSSFGCGSTSQITWFGRAFLATALNQTTDFERGFDLASKQIREWELAQGETPSVPQIAEGWAIRKHLEAWRSSVPPAAPVPFAPN